MRLVLTRLLGLTMLLVVGWLLLSISTIPSATTLNPIADARDRWHAQGIRSYRIALDVEVRGKRCFQQLAVRDGLVHDIIDTCDEPWLGILTVPRIFAVAERVSNLPQSRCFAASQICTCHRVFVERQYGFDAMTGLPELTHSRSINTYNWRHTDFWTHLMLTRDIPSCTGINRTLSIRLVAFTPEQ